jgi:3-oxoacyl-[acyl-carrier protein] reductase
MNLKLSGKVAVVCAASQGLGKAAALGFAREGAHVVMCARDRKRLVRAANDIRSTTRRKGQQIIPIVADVSKAVDIGRLVGATVKRFKRVDILVSNAGGPPALPFQELDDAQWEKGVSLTLMSTIRLIREVLPYMQKQRWGRIITITSLTAKQPSNDLIISSTLRPGILGLSKVLSNLHARDGITVNCVAPGYIMTARQEELSRARAGNRGLSFDQYVEEASKDIPAGRFGHPSELADVIVFLASEKASYISGATISVDGGLVKGLL